MPVGTEDEIAAAARSLIAKGIGTVIVTMGARGALLVTASDTRERLRRSASPPSIRPAPATPSSAASRAITPPARTSREALDKAVRYAANSVTRRGTQKAYATEGEFAAFCAGLPRGSP